MPHSRLEDDSRLGNALAALGRDIALSDDDVTTLEVSRDRTPAEPLTLP